MRGFGIRRAIYNHNKTLEIASKILQSECGIRHKKGEHNLCPICEQFNRAKGCSRCGEKEPCACEPATQGKVW